MPPRTTATSSHLFRENHSHVKKNNETSHFLRTHPFWRRKKQTFTKRTQIAPVGERNVTLIIDWFWPFICCEEKTCWKMWPTFSPFRQEEITRGRKWDSYFPRFEFEKKLPVKTVTVTRRHVCEIVSDPRIYVSQIAAALPYNPLQKLKDYFMRFVSFFIFLGNTFKF